MKKKKLFLSIALAMLSSVCIIAGCKNDGNDDEKGNENKTSVMLADFETWESGFQLIRTGQYFGQIRVNKDAQFVKSGKQSAQLHPMGSYRSGATPFMFFPTHSELFEFDYRDFSSVKNVTYEFYNNEDAPVNVAVGLVTSVSTIYSREWTTIEYQPLQSGWNTVTYEVNVSALAINADVTKIEGVYVAFENAKTDKEENAPDIYLDDVVIHYHSEKQEVKNLIDLKENEYLDFESDWQEFVVSRRGTDSAPDFEIVTASDYKVGAKPAEGEDDTRDSLQAKSGSKVLRFVTKQGESDNTYYPGIVFTNVLLEKSLFGQLTEEQYGATTFSFDIYYNGDNSTGKRFFFGIDFYSKDGKQRKEYTFYPEPYQWNTFSINIKQLYEDFKKANKNQIGLFEQPGNIEICWGSYSTGGDKEFFLDNMHFEQETIDTTAKSVIQLAPFVRNVKVGTEMSLPTYSIIDKYDIQSKATLSVYYNNNGTWEPAQVASGKVYVDKVGDYKIVASCVNGLGNETVQEYCFRGEEEVKEWTWATYDYADETDNVYIDGELSDTNKKEWLSEFEGAQGVIKASADNATQYGSGYLGFRFASQLLGDATELGWDYFKVRVYIEASAPSLNFYSWNKKILDNVKTGEWVELTITKDILNSGKTYVNRNANPVENIVFYEYFKELCGASVGNLLYTTSIKNTSTDSKVTYYIDEVTWGKYENGSWGNMDEGTADVYGGEWADPFRKENE